MERMAIQLQSLCGDCWTLLLTPVGEGMRVGARRGTPSDGDVQYLIPQREGQD